MVTKLETLAAKNDEEPAAAAPAHALEIHEALDAARKDWIELYALCAASPYQSFEFASNWFDTVGRAQNLTPMIVVARSASGRPLALLPLALDRRGPLRVAAFLCGRESNFNLALIHPNAGLDENALRRLLAGAATKSSIRPHLYFLRNQPRRFEGVANPLAFSDARPSPSFAYGLTLPRDAAELDARASRDARKKLRKKEQRLAQLGELRYEHRADGARALDIMRALIVQKSARLEQMGAPSAFDEPAMCDFLERATLAAGDGALEMHALSVSGRIVATYAGLTRGARFSAMLNSFDTTDAFARCSPGELLLRALLRNLVERGFAGFDLGAGEARYKNAVCDETIELCDMALPTTWAGALAAPMLMGYLRAKRRIKQTPWLANRAFEARRLFGRGAHGPGGAIAEP